MKFSLIHPSRGRSQIAHRNYQNWIGKLSGHHQVEHFLSLDNSDPDLGNYRRLFNGVTNILVGDNRNCVEATNRAAKEATGDILIYLSDDFDCPDKWDALLAGAAPDKQEYAIWVDDGHQANNTVLTIPIISSGLYKTLGYLFCPLYPSVWVDVDLWFVCSLRVCMVDARQLLFRHRHWTTRGGIPRDHTSIRHDNPQRNSEGIRIFEKRKKELFLTNGIIK